MAVASEDRHTRPAPVASPRRRRDPLWWVIAVLPPAVLVRFSAGPDGPPTGVGEWVLATLFALTTTGLVAVLLLGVRQGWRLARTGAGTDHDRAARRARSAGVTQSLVGSATLLLVVGVVAWLVVAAT